MRINTLTFILILSVFTLSCKSGNQPQNIIEKKPFSNQNINTEDHFCQKNLIFETLNTDSSDILFIGDSFIDNFLIGEMSNNTAIKNRGIQGEFTSGLLNLLPSITKIAPSKIFIYIGINDIIFNIQYI